ncbi:hypothetical protein C8R45DRAFT_1137576 [Mycena sanguinolenta]|nr:hypothetical protein C8R45DRAFT_1137576 [Mycena sanguinolenta]
MLWLAYSPFGTPATAPMTWQASHSTTTTSSRELSQPRSPDALRAYESSAAMETDREALASGAEGFDTFSPVLSLGEDQSDVLASCTVDVLRDSRLRHCRRPLRSLPHARCSDLSTTSSPRVVPRATLPRFRFPLCLRSAPKLQILRHYHASRNIARLSPQRLVLSSWISTRRASRFAVLKLATSTKKLESGDAVAGGVIICEHRTFSAFDGFDARALRRRTTDDGRLPREDLVHSEISVAVVSSPLSFASRFSPTPAVAVLVTALPVVHAFVGWLPKMTIPRFPFLRYLVRLVVVGQIEWGYIAGDGRCADRRQGSQLSLPLRRARVLWAGFLCHTPQSAWKSDGYAFQDLYRFANIECMLFHPRLRLTAISKAGFLGAKLTGTVSPRLWRDLVALSLLSWGCLTAPLDAPTLSFALVRAVPLPASSTSSSLSSALFICVPLLRLSALALPARGEELAVVVLLDDLGFVSPRSNLPKPTLQ